MSLWRANRSPADTPSLTLVDFLLARIGEDEAMAREVQTGLRGGDLTFDLYLRDGDITTIKALRPYNPARVLAECEAKQRLIVEIAREALAQYRAGDGAPGLMLRILAQPYADHPDYRQEWAP